jgi:hypothetical protein
LAFPIARLNTRTHFGFGSIILLVQNKIRGDILKIDAWAMELFEAVIASAVLAVVARWTGALRIKVFTGRERMGGNGAGLMVDVQIVV